MTASDPSRLVIALVMGGYVLMVLCVWWARRQADDHERQRRLEHAQFMQELDHHAQYDPDHDDTS